MAGVPPTGAPATPPNRTPPTGSYAAICFVPDLETGLPHAALGMVALIEVTDN